MTSYAPVESKITPGHWYVNECIDNGSERTLCIFLSSNHQDNLQRAIDYAASLTMALESSVTAVLERRYKK